MLPGQPGSAGCVQRVVAPTHDGIADREDGEGKLPPIAQLRRCHRRGDARLETRTELRLPEKLEARRRIPIQIDPGT
jgi:hypothetical protein